VKVSASTFLTVAQPHSLVHLAVTHQWPHRSVWARCSACACLSSPFVLKHCCARVLIARLLYSSAYGTCFAFRTRRFYAYLSCRSSRFLHLPEWVFTVACIAYSVYCSARYPRLSVWACRVARLVSLFVARSTCIVPAFQTAMWRWFFKCLQILVAAYMSVMAFRDISTSECCLCGLYYEQLIQQCDRHLLRY